MNEKILMKNPNIFLFKILLFFKIIHYCLLEICKDRDSPFLINEICASSCEQNSNCTIDNPIINTQYLNNIIYINEKNLSYLNLVVSENNNLYYMLSTWPESNDRFFYLLNNEGYGLLNKTNPFYNISINDSKTLGRFESDIFIFKLLSDTDNQEFLISISKSVQYIEIYDFFSNKIYFSQTMSVFDLSYDIFTFVGTNLKLKKNKNTYIIGLLACEYSFNGTEIPYFYLKKVNFTSLDIVNNKPLFDTQKVKCSKAKIILYVFIKIKNINIQ